MLLCTKSEKLTFSCMGDLCLSEGFNMYSRRIMILLKKTKNIRGTVGLPPSPLVGTGPYIEMIFKNAVPTLQRTYCVFVCNCQVVNERKT
jgi:hypothetical protein